MSRDHPVGIVAILVDGAADAAVGVAQLVLRVFPAVAMKVGLAPRPTRHIVRLVLVQHGVENFPHAHRVVPVGAKKLWQRQPLRRPGGQTKLSFQVPHFGRIRPPTGQKG